MLYLRQNSFNPPNGHFQCKAVKIWQKITWLKYWTIPKRNYFQLACSIIIIFTLPKVSLIPSNFTFCNKCLSIFSHLGSILIIIMFFDVFILHQPFLLQKDQNWYQESWLGLVQNYEGSATSPNFWSFFIKHFDLRYTGCFKKIVKGSSINIFIILRS